ncbi:MAG TPA: peptidylprolyl isomerase [Ktedonobacteraceae bacterium]|nr:peptidylprolyl isomerase [Ktedonobacteraceae bacterium]
MPKTKRAEHKRAVRVAKAHATTLPKLEVKEAPRPRIMPGYKPPSRGLARYPWAIGLTLFVIVAVVFGLYYYKAGPFASPKPKPAVVVKPNLTLPNPSPCLKVVSNITDTEPAPDKAAFDSVAHSYTSAPPMTIDNKAFYCVGINTNRGLIVVELDPQYAPITVNNFVFLAEHQFYDGLIFHRVVPGFVIQGGDPKGDGTGGPGYKFKDEPVLGTYIEGVIAMANSGANSNGSQFFITLANDTKTLTKSYNLFGRVVQGMDVALKIQGPDPSNSKTKNNKPDVMNHVLVVEVR